MTYNPQYPTTDYLHDKAKKRIPAFAYDYLMSGCFDDYGVQRNKDDMKQVQLQQHFVRETIKEPTLKASFCGIDYDLPIGVAPIGLQGFIWPKAHLILAKMARDYNVPYILSTLSTNSLEEVAAASDSQALFQLYSPEDADIRNHLIGRVKDAGYRALILTADIASFGYRPRNIVNGLAVPPKVSLRNFVQAAMCPEWSIRTLMNGFMPQFRSLTPYMQDSGNSSVGQFVNDKLMGGVGPEQLKIIRDMWDGPLIVKGILSEQDMELCIAHGIDGVVVSNHGARQLNAGETSISVLPSLVKKYGKKIHISFDSGIQSGEDVALALASGAEFTFSGRAFTYGVCALGNAGANHTIEMFQQQLHQVLCQIGCHDVKDLPKFLVK